MGCIFQWNSERKIHKIGIGVGILGEDHQSFYGLTTLFLPFSNIFTNINNLNGFTGYLLFIFAVEIRNAKVVRAGHRSNGTPIH